MSPNPLMQQVTDVNVAGFDEVYIHSKLSELPQYAIYLQATGAEINPQPCYDGKNQVVLNKVHVSPLPTFSTAPAEVPFSKLEVWIPPVGDHRLSIRNVGRIVKDDDVLAFVTYTDNGYGHSLDIRQDANMELLKARRESMQLASEYHHDPDDN